MTDLNRYVKLLNKIKDILNTYPNLEDDLNDIIRDINYLIFKEE